MSESKKSLLLLKPRGFCAGVVRAIDIVRIALEAFGPPIYVRKEIVHNRFVVEDLQDKGAIFVDSVEEVPEGERVIYSAHGVSPEVREHSKLRKLRVIDATCPLVTKVHVEAVKFAKEGYSLILIGHRDHDEVIGTLGEAPEVTKVVGSEDDVENLELPDPTRVAYLTQTTLSLDETRDILRFLMQEISPDTFVNLMPQYRPEGVASRLPAIARPLRSSEFRAAMKIAREEGLRRLARD